MQAIDEIGAQLAALDKCCEWLFVPKGRAPNGAQRVSARLMLRSFKEMDDADALRLKAIFEDWPAWLAQSGWTPEVVLAYPDALGEPVVRSLGKVDVGQEYSRQLTRQHLRQRSEIWRAAFPGAGETLLPMPRPEPTHYEAQPHAASAESANYFFGGLHSLAVAASVEDQSRPITEVGMEPINFANPPIGLRGLEGPARMMEDALRSIGQVTYRPNDRLNYPADFSAAFTDQSDPVLRWAGRTQVSEGLIKWNSPAQPNTRADIFKKLLACTAPDTIETRRFLKRKKDDLHAAKEVEKENGLKLTQDMQSIAHHGWLLRHLGLVVDFEVQTFTGGSSPPSPASESSPGAVVVSPSTGWPMMKPTNSIQVPRGLPQDGGLVQFDAKETVGSRSVARFKIVQVDVHSAARKLVQMIASQGSMADSAADPTSRTFYTSTQSSVGLSVVDTKARDARNNHSARRPKASRVGEYKILFAEDITIGIRPDVQSLQPREGMLPVQAPWKSLTGWKIREAHVKEGLFPGAWKGRRDVTDAFAGIDAGEAVIGSAQRMLASDGELVVVSSEELFTWSGWSLAVGHPDPGARGGTPAYTELHVNNLVVTLQADGDLPSLRIGRGYRFAARAVYPDAGGLTLAEGRSLYGCDGERRFLGEGANPDEFVPCMRYEPLAPPDIHLGERIDYADFPQAANRKAVLSSSLRKDHVRRREVRYIVPQPISLERAVLHGMYDAKERRSGPPASAFKGFCLTPEGRIPNVSNPVVPVESADGARRSKAGDRSDTIFHASPFARDPVTPYLPDPWARRVIVGVYRQSDAELLAWEYHDYYENNDLAAWPNCRALRLEILRAQDRYVSLPDAYGSKAGHVDLVKKGSTMRLVVPAGESLQLRFWHEMDERMLQQSGIVDQMAEYLTLGEAKDCVTLLGATGCLDNKPNSRKELVSCLSQWSEMRHARIRAQISRERARGLTNVTSFGMINPSEVLDVVHAVDQPARPSFLWSGLPSEEFEPNYYERYVLDLPARRLRSFEQSFRFRRERARSDATLAGDVEFDRASTQRLDIEVQWEDIDDDPLQPKPARSRKNAIVSVDNLPPTLTRPRGLTGHVPNARVTPDVPEDNNLLLLDGVRTRLGRRENDDLGQKKLQVSFGDSRARITNLTITGLSRFSREYAEGDGTFSSPQGKLEQVVCPASAPPRPVDLDYVIPQYRWQDNADGHKSHVREGGCFRVWLKRPWFSSGPDERLAIVCWPADTFDKNFDKSSVFSALRSVNKTFRDPAPSLEKFVTRWGLDPLWAAPVSATLNTIPPEAFRRHVCDVASLPMRTKQDACFPKLDLAKCLAVRDQIESYQGDPAEVVLVLYEPLYDDASRRWYVDIQIDEKYAYYPFLRLALARYQRYALPGMELSDILVQEFVQLPPTRKTQLTVRGQTREAGGTKLTLDITMTGAMGRPAVFADSWRTRVSARLEYLPVKTWQRLRESGPKPPAFHEVAWVPDGETVYLESAPEGGWRLSPRYADKTDTQLATGTVTLRDDRVYSVIVEECELGFKDAGRADLQPVPSVRRVFKDRLLISELP